MGGLAILSLGDTESAYRKLVTDFLAHDRETAASLQSALAQSPESARLHATQALMLVLLARSELKPAAEMAAANAVDLVRTLGGNASDRAFVDAAFSAASGRWRDAVRCLEKALAADPGDSLAAKMSHQFRFMLGDKSGMLGSATRVIDRLPSGHVHEGFLLGCKSFALEENGRYREAELTGLGAVEKERRDAWGLHAVSHVHEMTGRPQDGIAWIESNGKNFSHCNNFGGHLFWHLALFKLETGAIEEVFDLYDHHIRADRTDDFRDIANGASLLMRLELAGCDVGARWEELADKAEARLQDRALVFADLHYLMALAGAGRHDAASLLARSIGALPPAYADQARAAHSAGALIAEGIIDFANGEMEAALTKLLAARPSCAALGGSDAQRDVFEQITVEAALRAGDEKVAESLLSERLAQRHGSSTTRMTRLVRSNNNRRGHLGLAASLAYVTAAH